MGVVYHGVPEPITLALAKAASISAFVETGTFEGKTTTWAARHFKTIFTIERADGLYRQHHQKLERLAGVKPLFGDSRAVLPSVLAELGDRPALFWLDGHWSGDETAGEGDECPVLGELACLAGRPGDIVLIDDARLFLSAPPKPHRAAQWPTIADVVDAFGRERGANARPCIQVVDDVIFAVPKGGPLEQTLVDYAQQRSQVFWQAFGATARGDAFRR